MTEIQPPSDEQIAEWERDAAFQADGARRIEPYLPAIHGRIAQITKYIGASDLTLVLPESDWGDVEPTVRPVMAFGLRVAYADVATAMVALPAPAGRYFATVLSDVEAGGPDT